MADHDIFNIENIGEAQGTQECHGILSIGLSKAWENIDIILLAPNSAQDKLSKPFLL